MRLLFVLVMLLCSAPSFAQEACKGFRVASDEFGSGTNVYAPVQTIQQLTAVGMALELTSGTPELTVVAKEGGAVSATVPAGVEVLFSFSDGTITRLETTRATATKSYVSSNMVWTNVPFTFAVTPEQLGTMSTATLTAVRLPLSGGDWDWVAPKRVQKKLNAAAACVSEHVAPA